MELFTYIANRYLKQNQPKLYRQLKQEGRLGDYLQKIAKSAEDEFLALVEQGLRDYEAQEIVMAHRFPFPS